MKIRGMVAAALTVTTLTGAVVATTAGTASAMTRCEAIQFAMEDSAALWVGSLAQGDLTNALDWQDAYMRASRNYARFCRG